MLRLVHGINPLFWIQFVLIKNQFLPVSTKYQIFKEYWFEGATNYQHAPLICFGPVLYAAVATTEEYQKYANLLQQNEFVPEGLQYLIFRLQHNQIPFGQACEKTQNLRAVRHSVTVFETSEFLLCYYSTRTATPFSSACLLPPCLHHRSPVHAFP